MTPKFHGLRVGGPASDKYYTQSNVCGNKDAFAIILYRKVCDGIAERRAWMEGGNVLYFYLKEGARFKKHGWSRGILPELEVDMASGREADTASGQEYRGGGRLVCCGVPQYYRKGKDWKRDRLLEVLNGKLAGQEAEEYYLQPDVARMTGIKERMPPEIILQKVFRQIPCLEYLVYIGWGEEHREGALGEEDFREERQMLYRLLKPYLARVNHFMLVTHRPEGYEEFSEYIYEEYGIPAFSVDKVEGQFGKAGKTVVIDGRKEYKPPWQMLPQRASYVDLWSVEEKREQAEKNRGDVKYISAGKFLDTLVKNGYNTIVN